VDRRGHDALKRTALGAATGRPAWLLLAPCLLACSGAEPPPAPIRSLRGCIQREHRLLTGEGLSPPFAVRAAGLRFSIQRGSRQIAAGETDTAGCLEASFEPADGALRVEVTTVAVAPDGGARLGVGYLDDFSGSGAHWSFSTEGDARCGAPAVAIHGDSDGTAILGPWLLREECGAGAVAVFEVAREAMTLLDPGPSARAAPPLGVLWSPDRKGDCSACFLDDEQGGILFGGDHYRTSIHLSGLKDAPMQWVPSVIAHEVGHWAMSAYSRRPSAQGPHSFGQTVAAGLAFQEGWASAFGQRVLGRSRGVPLEPAYLAMQQGEVIQADLLALTLSSSPLPRPSLALGVEQPLNEFVVASALLRLWMTPDELGGPAVGLGDRGMLKLLESRRLRDGPDRGAAGVDLLDALDAIVCEGLATSEEIEQALSPLGFPWDGAPLCQ
jgi:hypothetical protein